MWQNAFHQVQYQYQLSLMCAALSLADCRHQQPQCGTTRSLVRVNMQYIVLQAAVMMQLIKLSVLQKWTRDLQAGRT